MAAGFDAQFGRDGDQGFGAAGKIGGKVEGRGGGQRDRARGGVSARLARLALAVARARRPQAWIQNFRRDQRHGPRPAQPEGDDHVEHPEREDFGFGRWGVREGGERQGGGLGGRRNRIPCPGMCSCRLAARRSGWPEPGRAAAAASRIRPGSRLGGRPARSRHSDKRFAAGPSGSPTAKRGRAAPPSSALRRRILAEAAAL